jgi:Flp pilus assembly protein TadD
MKNNKLSLFATLLAAIVLSSCGGLNKMKDTAKNLNYSVTPSPLEVKGGKIEVAVTGKFPAKYFNKKAVLEVTPVLKYEGGETALKPIKVQGESVQANNKVIKYTEGGSYNYSDTLSFKKEMMVSQLEIRVKATLGKSVADFEPVKVGDGVIATEYLVVRDPRAISLGDKFVRSTSDKFETDIKYLINQADIRTSETKKDELKKFNETLKALDTDPKKEIKGLELSSYASPDGSLELNEKLAGKRKESASKYFGKEFKKAKYEKVKDELFTYLVTPEDWDGFKALLEKSDLKDKELILRVLSMYSDPIVREKEIKNISAAYDDLKVKILPQLRRSKLLVNVTSNGKTDAELTALAQSKPDSLDLEEALFTANLLTDNNQKLAVYQASAKKYPADVRPINNVGYIDLKLNKVSDAKAAFETAQKIKDNEVVKNNLGVIALLEGDLKKAEDLFTAALSAGEVVNYNLGIIKIIQGKYSDAINYFGNAAEVNAALAKLLIKQNDQALTTLNGVKSEDAIVSYLRAIVGARTQNTDMLFTNLRIAAGKSAALKANAAKDMEFAKYFQDATFKSIVQ